MTTFERPDKELPPMPHRLRDTTEQSRPPRVTGLLAGAVLLVGAAACSPLHPSASAHAAEPAERTVGSVTTAAPGSCRYRAGGVLPDPSCTPGDADPRVTPGTIQSTICAAGWSKRVRPPVSVTGPIKKERMHAYAVTAPSRSVELDHLLPIELGGATSTANLWPENWDGTSGAHVKDKLENRLHALVCAGKVPLRQAQTAITHDWTSAYRTYVGPLGRLR